MSEVVKIEISNLKIFLMTVIIKI